MHGQSFVGRAFELATLKRLLEEGAPLVTVVGPGGCGKTTLAKQLADAHFCDLSEVVDEEGIRRVVARAIGAPRADQVERTLADRGDAIVVLDNFEQLVSHAAIVDRWIRAAPRVTFVLTSRERLGLEQPLSPPPEGARPEELRANDAVRLFLERCALAPEADALEEIAALVRRVDGLPLAIELCAARANVLSPAEIVQRLEGGLAVLVDGKRASARHRSLGATLDWSWSLTSAPEKELLATLTVFRGGCDVSAASAVLGRDAADLLGSLLDKSLVQRDVGRRFFLLDTIRAAILERAAPPDGALERHAQHYLEIARRTRALSLRDPALRARLARDLENLLLVHERATSSGDAPRALEALLACELVFAFEGDVTRYTTALRALLDRRGAELDHADLARAWSSLGDALSGQGSDELVPVFERALDHARAAADEDASHFSRVKLAGAHVSAGDPARAAELLREVEGKVQPISRLRAIYFRHLTQQDGPRSVAVDATHVV